MLIFFLVSEETVAQALSLVPLTFLALVLVLVVVTAADGLWRWNRKDRWAGLEPRARAYCGTGAIGIAKTARLVGLGVGTVHQLAREMRAGGKGRTVGGVTRSPSRTSRVRAYCGA